jgi:hypothetical protein
MIEVLGTIEKGGLTLDAALPFQDRMRVRLTIEPVETATPASEAQAALDRIMRRLEVRPVHGGGITFTREELHDRD